MRVHVLAQIGDGGSRFQVEIALLMAAAVVLVAVTVFLALRTWSKRHGGDFAEEEDDAATEVAGHVGFSPHAYLMAEEDYKWIPAQIELYAETTTTIGRNSSECTVQLNDIGISRRHAMITWRKGSFYLSDSGSRGGTFLYRKNPNSGERTTRHRLSALEERRLRDGDVVKFYTFAYRFQEGEMTIIQDEHETQPTS